MKVSTLLLSLLALTLLHQALSTHLQTCECHQIRDLVNTTVQEALAGLENRLTLLITSTSNTTDSQALDQLKTNLTATMERLLNPIQQQLNYHLPPKKENSRDNPATSCKALHEQDPQAASGYYWIGESGSAVRVYCSMSGTCGSETGGWMRVAHLDMRNTSHTCPSGLTTLTSPKRLCDMSGHSGCVSNSYSAQGVQYSRVCGKVIAYQQRYPIAFHNTKPGGIDGPYGYGVSLTHGQNPRNHIWTFAGASDETTRNPTFKCPCINTGLSSSRVPSYIGNDYFCDTALSTYYTNYSPTVQPADPLWDGKGCGPTNTCCSFNSPPWFTKTLLSPTTDSIEMRVCRPSTDGSTPIEIVEFYVQ